MTEAIETGAGGACRVRDASGQRRSAGEKAAAIDRPARVRSRRSAPELQDGGERARVDPDGNQPSGPVARGDLPATAVPPSAASDRADDSGGEAVSRYQKRLRRFCGGIVGGERGIEPAAIAGDDDERLCQPLWRAAQPQIELEIIG